MSGLDEFKQKQNKSRAREVVEKILIILVLILIFRFLLMSVRVSGSSMLPNYVNGERGIALRTNIINKPNFYSVVIAKAEIKGEKSRIVKRVFGLPNDTVEIKENEVFVNGKKVEDLKRANDTKMENYPLITLASDEYFVLGDNRNISIDSRTIGPIKENQIEAVNGIVFWPITKVGLMN